MARGFFLRTPVHGPSWADTGEWGRAYEERIRNASEGPLVSKPSPSAGGKAPPPPGDLPPPQPPFTAQKALEHYLAGSGTPVRIGFKDIDTDGIKITDFDQVRRLIASQKSGKIDSRRAFSTRGNHALMLGNIQLRLQGELSVSKDGYTFSGTLKSFDDLYDFNPSDHRSAVGEALTRLGSRLPGRPYAIEIRGQKEINEAGALPQEEK